MQTIKDFFHSLFNLTMYRKWRIFSIAWTGFFVGYEAVWTFVSVSPWSIALHGAALVIQATFFVAFIRAKAV